VWVNPDPEDGWDQWHTTRIVRRLFPMYSLSVDGVTDAFRTLVGARA
jgi:uncharacterized protein with von Willebrand factor type A (vWA) domain